MLLHELSSHKVRLLLSVLMLKDAGRNHYAIAGVDPIVSDEPRYFADEGHKALLDQLARLLRVGNTIVSAHCNVHSSNLPPSHRGRGDQPHLKLINATTLARSAEFRMNSYPTSENAQKAKFGEFTFYKVGCIESTVA